MAKNGKHISNLILFLTGILLLNLVGNYFYERFDLTRDSRYTLSEAGKNTLATVDSPLLIEVFLKGDFPPEFRRLQWETEQLLDEFSAVNPNVKFEFINPLEETKNSETFAQEFSQMGLIPAQVEVQESGKITTELVYPWALAHYNGSNVQIPLLKNQLGATSEERVSSSIQNLEYAFANGFRKLAMPKSRKVAVLKGNGELDDRYLADFLSTLKEYYFIAPFTLDSVVANPVKTLSALNEFDLIIMAKPTEAFTEAEKYVLDQFTMNGGASLWLIETNEMKQDSLSGRSFVFGKDLNLNDFFFKYGLRINPNLVNDLYSAPIVLAMGSEREAQYSRYPWFFNPLVSSANSHSIVTNIEAVKFEYAGAIDTLPNDIEKTILLATSPITKIVGLPYEIDFDKEIPENLLIVNEGPDPLEYNAGEVPLAVLLEGGFSSVYKNRVKPFKFSKDKSKGNPTKMIVISDGDVIKNQLQGNRPLELGFDKMTNTYYGNKEFLLNAVNYLLDDSGLINIRTKKIAIPFLDQQKSAVERSQWQLVNLLLPLVFLTVFGGLFSYFRKRKYGR